MYCHKCGHKLEADHKIGREETCPECTSYLHCCLNCRFYDPFSNHECRETEVEWVQDKESGNFCDYFKPSDRFQPRNTKRDEAKKKLDDLFGKKSQ